MARSRQHRRNENVDFNDEEAVLGEVAKALKEDPEDCSIDEDRGLTGFGEGIVYRVKCGRMEYCVVEDDDAAYALAKASVSQDLEHEPEIFSKDFLEGHINKDRLRRDLRSDVEEMIRDDLREMSDREFWKRAESYIEVPDEDEDGDRPDVDDYLDDVADAMVEERLKDPMEYLEEIYGDEAAAQAIKIAGFDIDAAAEDAIDTDGWQHFLARYDGNSEETRSGFVFWREN